MKKILTLLCLASLALVFTGCKTQNPALTAAIVRATVSTGALFGIESDPTIVPYLQAATPIICDAAGTSHLNPVEVVQALQSINPKLKTATGVAVINSALALYESLYAAYGTNVQASVVQPYLEGVCLGLRDALPVATLRGVNAPAMLPPHIVLR
jgi:hypothetical protein